MRKTKGLVNIVLFFPLIILNNAVCAQSSSANWKDLFYQSYYIGFRRLPQLRDSWMKLSNSNHIDDIEPLSYGLDAVLAMFEATDSVKYLDDAITFTNNVTNWAQISKHISGNLSPYKDSYRGWIEKPMGSEKGLYNQEGVLWESYFFEYVSRLLKDIHNDKRLLKNKKYKKFYLDTLEFVENDVWGKWESRGISIGNKYRFLLLGRTHMASHWAYIAAELSFLTTSAANKTDYLSFVNLYNYNLERNFYKYDNYISWNSTWDYNLDSTKNINPPIVQDVSHANLVVSYLVEAHDLGLWNDVDAIKRLINTLKYKLWDSTNCTFKDDMEGVIYDSKDIRPKGVFQADGFVKLTRYDSSLFQIYQKFLSCTHYISYGYQYGQLFANLTLSEQLISKNNVNLSAINERVMK